MSHSPALGGALRRPSLVVAAGGAAVALGVALWRLRGRGWRSGPTGFAAKAEADAVQAPGYRFSDPEVRWGIIGVGDVCEVKSGPGFYKAKGSRLVAVMRRTLSAAQDFAERHGVPRAYGTVDALLSDEAVNAVYVASPVGSHLEHALAAAKAGLPTIMEKPLGRCAEEARQIVEAFESAGVPLWVAYYRRSHPCWLALKAMLERGDVGDVVGITYDLRWELSADVRAFVAEQEEAARREAGATGTAAAAHKLPWRLDPAASGGGLVMDVGAHAVDILEFLFGPLELVPGPGTCARRSKASEGPYRAAPVEDEVRLEFVTTRHGRVRGQMRWDFAGPAGRGKEETLTIVGTRGTVEAGVLGSKALRVTMHTTGGAATPTTEVRALPPPAHVHQNFIQACVNELLGTADAVGAEAEGGPGLLAQARSPCTGKQGLRANELLDGALVEFYGGERRAGFWTRMDPREEGEAKR